MVQSTYYYYHHHHHHHHHTSKTGLACHTQSFKVRLHSTQKIILILILLKGLQTLMHITIRLSPVCCCCCDDHWTLCNRVQWWHANRITSCWLVTRIDKDGSASPRIWSRWLPVAWHSCNQCSSVWDAKLHRRQTGSAVGSMTLLLMLIIMMMMMVRLNEVVGCVIKMEWWRDGFHNDDCGHGARPAAEAADVVTAVRYRWQPAMAPLYSTRLSGVYIVIFTHHHLGV